MSNISGLTNTSWNCSLFSLQSMPAWSCLAVRPLWQKRRVGCPSWRPKVALPTQRSLLSITVSEMIKVHGSTPKHVFPNPVGKDTNTCMSCLSMKDKTTSFYSGKSSENPRFPAVRARVPQNTYPVHTKHYQYRLYL